MKTVAVDFDGVLCEDSADIHADFRAGRHAAVKPGAAAGMAWLKKQGYEVLVWTARPHTHRRHLEVFLRGHGIPFDDILYYTKPHAALYIDDKALRFTGWAAVIEALAPGSPPVGQEPNTLFEEALRLERGRHLDWTGVRRVLDVGAGRRPAWPEGVTGDVVEPDPEFRSALAEDRRVECVFAALAEARAELGEYDLVLATGVLEHVPDDAGLLAGLAGARRIFLTVPNGASFHRHVGRALGLLHDLAALGAQDQAVGHVRYYLPRGFESLVRGFAGPAGYRCRFGSSGFKFADNRTMSPFAGLAAALHVAADEAGLTGDGCLLGAELYAELVSDPH